MARISPVFMSTTIPIAPWVWKVSDAFLISSSSAACTRRSMDRATGFASAPSCRISLSRPFSAPARPRPPVSVKPIRCAAVEPSG